MESVGVGASAPDFQIPDENGTPWRLSAHRGKVVALLFYPKDQTTVCTYQMCSVRDRWPDYQSTGAEVVAVSIGSVASHKKFATRYNMPQRLLADERGEVSERYGLRSIFGSSKRAVVVVDGEGIIRHYRVVFPLLRPSDDEVLEAIRATMG
jgi:thioredoxin-dependent peroxiredoxin